MKKKRNNDSFNPERDLKIGEKIDYYNAIFNDKKSTYKEQLHAYKRLEELRDLINQDLHGKHFYLNDQVINENLEDKNRPFYVYDNAGKNIFGMSSYSNANNDIHRINIPPYRTLDNRAVYRKKDDKEDLEIYDLSESNIKLSEETIRKADEHLRSNRNTYRLYKSWLRNKKQKK